MPNTHFDLIFGVVKCVGFFCLIVSLQFLCKSLNRINYFQFWSQNNWIILALSYSIPCVLIINYTLLHFNVSFSFLVFGFIHSSSWPRHGKLSFWFGSKNYSCFVDVPVVWEINKGQIICGHFHIMWWRAIQKHEINPAGQTLGYHVVNQCFPSLLCLPHSIYGLKGISWVASWSTKHSLTWNWGLNLYAYHVLEVMGCGTSSKKGNKSEKGEYWGQTCFYEWKWGMKPDPYSFLFRVYSHGSQAALHDSGTSLCRLKVKYWGNLETTCRKMQLWVYGITQSII